MDMNIDWHSPLIHSETCLERSGRIGQTNRTLSFLRLSAASGCPGCTLAVQAIEKWCRAHVAESRLKILSKKPDPEDIFDEKDIQSRISRTQGSYSGTPMLNVRFWEGEFGHTNLGGVLEVFREPEEWVRATERKGFGKFTCIAVKDGIRYEFDGEKPELHQLVGAGRVREKQSDSEVCLGIIKGWMKTCSEDHPQCAILDPKYIPFRVLDVGFDLGFSRVKLVENPTREAQYIALSHCWGKHVPSTTTMESLERRRVGISISELPKTFQDAVALSRKLGVRYLWIDSLCIVQDSLSDWATESSKMHKIYSNATLVLAATRSPDSTYGLFHTRSPSEQVVLDFHTIPSTKGSGLVSLNVRLQKSYACHSNFHVAKTDLASFPLLTRAWCLQERILATRVLHFCDEELVWECHAGVKCECMGLDTSHSANWGFKQRWAVIMDNATGFDAGSGSLEYRTGNHAPEGNERLKAKKNAYEAWHMIVNTASKLQITKESDKLPALSGIAQKMIDHGAGAYSAGLWEEYMKRDLLWAATHIVVSRLDLRPVRRASEWRAPSWSWASMESAEITFPDDERSNNDEYEVNITEVKSTPLGNDPTGNVIAGSLQIEGLVTECLLGRELKDDLQNFHCRTLRLDDPESGERLVCSMICDTDASSEKDNGSVGRKVLTLLMRRDKRSPGSGDPTPFHALVLRASRGLSGREGERGCYERIGIVQWDRLGHRSAPMVRWEKWFANAETRTLVLV